jgi:CheY-like chemotaxis protein
MKSEVAFDCLLVSHDPSVLSTMDRILQGLSIRTDVCPNTSIAANLLTDGGTDLIVIDLESERSMELIHTICESGMRQKPTILAVSTTDRAIPGVHIVLRKPVTPESGAKSLQTAYSRMLRDYRKHTRFALMTPVLATDEKGRIVSVTVANIGEGGVGLTSTEKLGIGSVLDFQVRLPGLRSEVDVRARVLWNRQSGAAGCEFVSISPSDLQILHAWLESRYRFKAPLIPVQTIAAECRE